MKANILFVLGLVAAICGLNRAHAEGRGDEVMVIYNTRVPESKDVAEHYAERRQVPPSQVLGFDLPTIEAISRTDYRDRLEKPLAKAIKDKQLFRFGTLEVPTADGHTRKLEDRVLEAKIRYVVLCYGVPLKIGNDAALKEEGASNLRTDLRRNDAAIDNELACLPLLEQNFLRAGPLLNPLYAVTNGALLNPTNSVLMVARLDGPTAEIARSLVDKAMQAETNGLWGRAYFDLRGLTSGDFKIGDDWLHSAEETTRLLGFETVVDDKPDTFPVSFPLSQVALYAGWYDESVSGPFTQPTVEFMPGAFAYHLHSFSAATLRSTTHHWSGPLLAKGVTATMGTVEEPFLTGTPDMGIFFPRFIYSGFTYGEAAYACQHTLSWQTTVVGDPLYRPFPKNPIEQTQDMERQGSKYLDWAYLRLINLQLVNHTPLADVIAKLDGLLLTHQSAVLMEKLADLYELQGKPSTSVEMLQHALELNPSPQQRIRVMLLLVSRLIALDRSADAYLVCQQFNQAFPEYPDQLRVVRQLVSLAQKLGKKDDAAKYELEVSRLSSPGASLSKKPPVRPGL